MLLEFSLKNFRSIGETQTFSMLASTLRDLQRNVISLDVPNKIGVLRSAAIYGANASGKSNFIMGLRTVEKMVINSSAESQRGDALAITPFRLDPDLTNEPSEFDITFISEGVRYQYGFIANSEKIFDEWLFAFPKNRPQKWFYRSWNDDRNDYEWEFSPYFLGEKQIWVKATRVNALFLSAAIQLNSTQLPPVFNWFKKNLRVATYGGWADNFSAKLCTDERKNEILKFMQAADTGIDDLSAEKENFNPDMLSENIPLDVRQAVIDNFKNHVKYNVNTYHKNKNGDQVAFKLEDESDGTRRLFSFSGPWLDALKNGYILFIDELHNSLHPKLVRYLVDLFNDPKTNPNNAQLVFTTHETSILNQDIFRRDQIWFCEKNTNNQTRLYPLTDYSPRKGRENLEASYLDGRYGAIPFITKNHLVENNPVIGDVK